MHRILSLAVALLLSVSISSAKDYTVSKRIGSSEKLSNNFVNDILAMRGDVWVSTASGVNRITGLRSIVLKSAGITKYPIENQKANEIVFHKQASKILFGTEVGLYIYCLGEGRVRQITAEDGLPEENLNDISIADENSVWLFYSTGKVFRFNCNDFTAEAFMPELIEKIRCGFFDGNRTLYIGHEHSGMSVIDIKNNTVTRYVHEKGNVKSIPGNNVRRIYVDKQHRMWVGTEHGMALFSKEKKEFYIVRHHSEQCDDNVYDIMQMNNGELWVASDYGGISIIDPEALRGNVENLHYSDARVELSSANARSIAQDEYGNIWVGNYSMGVDFISTREKRFHQMSFPNIDFKAVSCLAEGPGGQMWLGGNNMIVLCQNGMMVREWMIPPMTREYSFVRTLMVDKSGYVWIGVDDEGILRLNTATNSFERINTGLDGADTHSFYEDEKGNVWIGTEFGVYLWSKETNTVAPLDKLNKQLSRAPVSSFVPLNNGKLLLATHGVGVYVYDLKTQTGIRLAKVEDVNFNKINHAIKGNGNDVWLASYEGLVHIEDAANLKGITIYNKQDGLVDSHIRAVQQDASGRIWISTYSGIVCLDNGCKEIHNYGFADFKEEGFFGGGTLTTGQNIFFASASGVCYFNPELFNNETRVSDVQITSCELFSTAENAPDEKLHIPVDRGEIEIDYKHNTFTLLFSVCNQAQIGHEEYSYMIKNKDDGWFYLGDNREVVFSNMPPGKYEVVIRAKLKSQDWDDATQTQLTIVVKPPFWRTWWAYLIYLLLAAGIIFDILRSYNHRLKLQNTLALEKQKNEQNQLLHEERLRFFTNITHELRTPLTLILGPLESLKDSMQLSPQNHRTAELIFTNAVRLKELINQILEFRKTETQNRRLTVAKDDLGQLVKGISLSFAELNRKENVHITQNISSDLPQVYFDSEVITTVLSNFLSNAIKYTDKGNINISVAPKDDKWIRIAVEDTGHGIEKNALKHVFERYYQAKDKMSASGTGIGLALVKSLAELHEGRIEAESTVGVGSTFAFLIRTDNTYPNALHKDDTEEEEVTEVKSTPDIEKDGIITVLIVEDNADIREYINDSLSNDFKVLQASNGEEGAQMAFKHIPDVIVSDIMMPKMDGIEMMRMVKQDIRTSHIPVILLTAKDSIEDKTSGYEGGADSYLTKPFSARLLTTRIQSLIKNRHKLAEWISSQKSLNALPQVEANVEETGFSIIDRDFIDKLNKIIEENIVQEDITVPFLAENMNMSHATFYRKVKALTNMTAKEYVRKKKLQHCYEMLKTGEHNVNEVAFLTGFKQLAHFREVFKTEFGILPSDVNKQK